MSRHADGAGRKPHRWRGRWRSYLTIGYKANGDPIRKYVYGTTQSECLEALDELRQHHREGSIDPNRSPTLRAYLEEWLETKSDEVGIRTVEIYRSDLGHLLPLLGKIRLENLKALQIQKAVRAVARDVSSRAARYGRATLATALNDAVRLGLLLRNPVTATKPVRYEPEEITVWSASEVTDFLAVAQGSTYFALFYTALTTGARPGELYALTWDDLQEDRLFIQRTASGQGRSRRIGPTKTKAGRRVLRLPADTIRELHEHRTCLQQQGMASALMFPSGEGNPLNPSNVARALTTWSQRAGVTRLRPHDLRHTFASMAIAQGMTPAELARQLGHTDPGFTLRRYVHFFERYQPREAPTLAELTGAPVTLPEPVGGTVGGTSPKIVN